MLFECYWIANSKLITVLTGVGFLKISKNNEIIIDKYHGGHATVVRENGKIVDCYIDPPFSFVFILLILLKAKIERKISNIGGYFITLPNRKQGFLKSKRNYKRELTLLQSRVFFEIDKPQFYRFKIYI